MTNFLRLQNKFRIELNPLLAAVKLVIPEGTGLLTDPP